MPRRKRTELGGPYKDRKLANMKYLSLLDQACSPGADRRVYDRYISFLGTRYDETGNPYFVWEALSSANALAIDDLMIREAGSLEQLEKLNIQESFKLRIAAQNQVRDFGLKFPPWCVQHLLRWASSILITFARIELMNVLDLIIRDPHRKIADWTIPTLATDEAAKILPTLLECTKPGKNAFDQRQRDYIALNIEQEFKNHVVDGFDLRPES